MKDETWKDIEDYEGYYQVSNKGRVRSVDRVIVKSDGVRQPLKGRILKQRIDDKGYCRVHLSTRGDRKCVQVHRLVATEFIENNLDKPDVNHKDFDTTNNYVENLEWVTKLENNRHSLENGRYAIGEDKSDTILSDNQVIQIRNAYRLGCFTYQEIADAYGVSKAHIGNIIIGKRRYHV